MCVFLSVSANQLLRTIEKFWRKFKTPTRTAMKEKHLSKFHFIYINSGQTNIHSLLKRVSVCVFVSVEIWTDDSLEY